MGKRSRKSVTVQQVKETRAEQQVEPTRLRQDNSRGRGQQQRSRSQGTRSGDTIPTTNLGGNFHDVSLDTDDPPMDVTELKGELEEIDITIDSCQQSLRLNQK
jgi:hypothetical protein